MSDIRSDIAARQAWLSLLATAPEGQAAQLLDTLDLSAEHMILRAPEIGSVMTRARAGGTGAPFNLGEVSITRCSVTLASGEVGHGYVQGRRKPDAKTAALIDALMQTEVAARVRAHVLDPLEDARAQRRAARAARAAATKVEFFTMARGEDT